MAHSCVKNCASHSLYVKYSSFAVLAFSLDYAHMCESCGWEWRS